MPRAKVNKEVSIPLGQRLETLATHHLKMSWTAFANKLGYRNPSTLHKIRTGDSLPSAEKLYELALLQWDTGGRVNINWLLTGSGEPLLYDSSSSLKQSYTSYAGLEPTRLDEVALTNALLSILNRSKSKT